MSDPNPVDEHLLLEVAERTAEAADLRATIRRMQGEHDDFEEALDRSEDFVTSLRSRIEELEGVIDATDMLLSVGLVDTARKNLQGVR